MNAVYYYISINALIMMLLAVNVILGRGKNKVSLGDGGFSDLTRSIRAHGNNTEYTPIVLILLLALGLKNANMTYIHITGLCLTLGRLFHGIGLTFKIQPGRLLGMVLTFIAGFCGLVFVIL